MNKQILGLRVAGLIFGLMSFGQLLRLLTHAEIVLAGVEVPLWVSALGAVATGSLSVWYWKLARSIGK